MTFWYEFEEELETGIFQIEEKGTMTGEIVHIREDREVVFLGSDKKPVAYDVYRSTFGPFTEITQIFS